MANTFGQIFKITSFGESHGKAIGGIIDGCPAGISIDYNIIQKQLDRRKPGQSKITSSRNENDEVEFLSGIFDNKTLGTPIGFVIKNNDAKIKDYDSLKNSFRPSHADFVYEKKYGIRDYRGGGRSSARETAMRVAAGAVAKKVLSKVISNKVEIIGSVIQLGPHKINKSKWNKNIINKNDFFCGDQTSIKNWESYLTNIRKKGLSCGAIIEIIVKNIPVGLGEPIYQKLDSNIASALMSINAVKGVEIGDGFSVVDLTGETNADEIRIDKHKNVKFLSNHSGGILGGISSGQDIISRFVVKPTSSILKSRKTITKNKKETNIITKGRHDPCVGIRAVPVGEAMIAIVLADHALQHIAITRNL